MEGFAWCGLTAAFDAQQFVQDQADGTQGDGAVGQVERGEVNARVVKVQEVHHIAVEHAVNHIAHSAAQHTGNGKAKQFLSEVITAMHKGNHDNSDIMTDYFDVGWYIDVNIGKWNQPYALVK